MSIPLTGKEIHIRAEAPLGCLPQAVTLIASVECSETVKILPVKKNLLRNRLLFVDLMENTFDIYTLSGCNGAFN